MRGAAILHADTYEEVEADRSSIVQASAIVVAAALSNAVGTWLALAGHEPDARRLVFQVLLSALLPPVIWLGGSTFSYMAGASFFRTAETETDFAEVMRTTGFAFTPGLLLGFGATPPLAAGIAIVWVVRLWVLVAAIVAIRQALDFSTARAIGSFGSAAVILWLILWGLAAVPRPF
jgi:hypothetical protein